MNWDVLSAASVDEVLAWANDQPWCRAMADCQQDAEWHAEGDVWTHTKMVCQQLPLLDEWPALDKHAQTVLLFTALFHDSAKPLTSQANPETGRIQTPKHAVKGEHLARAVLRDVGCDLITREEIARLVRFHGRPAFLLEKPDPGHEVISLSWLVDNRLLYLFALADTRGRSTASTTRPEENLHYFRLTAEEQNCFGQRYAFVNDQARFLFYRQSSFDLHYVPHEQYRCTVTMLAGLPGSGKDSWLAKNRAALPVVSLDDLREEMEVGPTENQGQVIQAAQNRCRELLRAGNSFAFNATNLLRQTRARWLDLFAAYDARIELVYVEPPWQAVLRQNRRRERPVPESAIRALADKCEPPTWTEAHNLVFVES